MNELPLPLLPPLIVVPADEVAVLVDWQLALSTGDND